MALLFPKSLTLRFSTGTRLDTPYAVQYNLGAEGAVGERSIASANVVRALGYHQALMKDLNPPHAERDAAGCPVHERDPTVGSIAAVVTEGRSWYTGVDLGWRWQKARLAYGRSRTPGRRRSTSGADPLKGGIYLPPDSNDIAGEKGRTDSDRRHRGVVAGEGRLPWFGDCASRGSSRPRPGSRSTSRPARTTTWTASRTTARTASEGTPAQTRRSGRSTS